MASQFTGTQTKCKVCSKTVYLVEQLIVEGVIYHKACFRCNHCKGTLKLNSFASLEGVLYCKPHFNQIFKTTGSYTKGDFEKDIKAEKEQPPPPESVTASALKFGGGEKKTNPHAFRFSGTQEKCVLCNKTVYPLEKVSVENTTYHSFCFKCVYANCKLTPSTYAALNGKLYCKPHFKQLFLSKGNFSELGKQNGDEGQAASAAAPAAEAVTAAVEAEKAVATEGTPAPAAVEEAAAAVAVAE